MTTPRAVHRIDLLPLPALQRWHTNPKQHDLATIEASMLRWGFTLPLLLDDSTERIVAGHGRLQVLLDMAARGDPPPDRIIRENGTWLVPVIRGVGFTDSNEGTAYLLADNRLVEKGGWAPDLDDLLAELDAAGEDMLRGTGFTLGEEYDGPEPVDHGALTRRFGAPPFSVLDTRQGYWQERKRQWLALGIRSELGRKLGALIEEDAQAHLLELQGNDGGTLALGTSIFDPVLCELAYSWFCPPGGRVLDPFAGGSVRGIVASWMGYDYTGIDLLPDQVAANEAQLAQLPPPAVQAADSQPEYTPWEQHGGHWVKRDDLYQVAGQRGGKVRTCMALAQGAAGLVTAGTRWDPQSNIVAHIAQALGIPCRVHVPTGDLGPELLAAMDVGAEIVRHRGGYSTVLAKRARDDAAERGWVCIPMNMDCPEAVEFTAGQVDWVPDVQRLVVPTGSGMTLAGVLWGLQRLGSTLPVVGVWVGLDPRKNLAKYAPPEWESMCTLVEAGGEYSQPAKHTQLGGLQLDPYYEAKCLPHLQPGDALWVVGLRQTAQAPARRPVPPAQVVPGTKPEHEDGRPVMRLKEGTPNAADAEALDLYNATSSTPLRGAWPHPVPDALVPYLQHVYDAFDQPLVADTVPTEVWGEAVDDGTCWVAFSGGKDSMAAALKVREMGYRPVLYHINGLNRAWPGELEFARKAAEAAGMPLVVDKVSVTGKKEGVIEMPTKNQVTALQMVARMLEYGGAHYTMGCSTSEVMAIQEPTRNWSDAIESVQLFDQYLQARVPGLTHHQVTVNTTDNWATVAAHGLLEWVHGCMAPIRFAPGWRKQKEAKYGPLLPGRCGTCFKCCAEWLILDALGAVPHWDDYEAYCLERTQKFRDEVGNQNAGEVSIDRDMAAQLRRDTWPQAPQLPPDASTALPALAVEEAPHQAPARGRVQWLVGDAREVLPTLGGGYDLVWTCPPYGDLEVYSDDPADLSTMEHPAFLEAYADVLAKAVAQLADDRFLGVVLSDFRDAQGLYRGFAADTVQLLRGMGVQPYNQAVLVNAIGTLPLRAGRAFNATRKLGRTHQEVLWFVKGDPRKAAEACGVVDLACLDGVEVVDDSPHQGAPGAPGSTTPLEAP